MHLEFFGAAGEVTGSCHILHVGSRTLLLDCGMIQGGDSPDERNRQAFPFDAAGLDAVILSHAHIDHCGRLPLLCKRGFRGPIHATAACRDLARILLADSASMAERDAERENRKRAADRNPRRVEPLYTVADAAETVRRFVVHPYDQPVELASGVRVTYRDAGHILGSASVLLDLEEQGRRWRVLFSGDIGQYDSPILRDPVTHDASIPCSSRAPTAIVAIATARTRCASWARFCRRPAGWRQRADAGVRRRPQPGSAVRARHALRRLAARGLADLPRQPDGDRGVEGLLGARRALRRGGHRGASARHVTAADPESAADAHDRGIDGDQPHRPRRDRDRRQRDVHGRPHRPSSQAQPVAAGVRRRLHRVPGAGHARSRDRRQSRVRAHPRPAIQGGRARAHARRLLGTRRPGRPAALVRAPCPASRTVWLVHGEAEGAAVCATHCRAQGATAEVARPGLRIGPEAHA